MPESRFIKTVTFGGFDKNDVNKRLNSLYKQIYDLKNELRETKLTIEKYKKGTDEEKAHESVLGVERAKLTELQVKNEAANEKIKEIEEELRQKDQKISDLEEKNQSLEKTVKETRNELEGIKAGDDPDAISIVFSEAQKSADLIKSSARAKAKDIEEKAKKLSENTVQDADNTAAQIIYDAEKKAAEIEADALNKAEEIKVSSENLRAKMTEDISKIYKQISELKTAFEVFAEKGYSLLDDSENLLRKTEEELKNGETPVFRILQHIEPKYPDAPTLVPVDHNYETQDTPEPEKQDDSKNDSLKKLQAMAAALDSDEDTPDKSQPDTGSSQDTAKQTAPEKDTKEEKKKSGGIDLSELMKQAAALDD